MTSRISYDDTLHIVQKGKYYPQPTNHAGLPVNPVFCDNCGRGGLGGSWKIQDTPQWDICMQCYVSLQHQQNTVLNNNQQPAFHPLMPDLHLQPQQQPQNQMNTWNAWNDGGGGIADYNQVWNQDNGIPNSYANIIIDSSVRENNYTSTNYNAPGYNNKRW
jgi:hypothetical protein